MHRCSACTPIRSSARAASGRACSACSACRARDTVVAHATRAAHAAHRWCALGCVCSMRRCGVLRRVALCCRGVFVTPSAALPRVFVCVRVCACARVHHCVCMCVRARACVWGGGTLSCSQVLKLTSCGLKDARLARVLVALRHSPSRVVFERLDCSHNTVRPRWRQPTPHPLPPCPVHTHAHTHTSKGTRARAHTHTHAMVHARTRAHTQIRVAMRQRE